MSGKNKIKQVSSLHQKKYRKKYNLFFVEGIKNTNELLRSGFEVTDIIGTAAMLKQITGLSPTVSVLGVSAEEYKKLSLLKTPPEIMAVSRIPEPRLDPDALKNNMNLVLDTITDPGNLGTIIRTAHWFGIKNIVCSPGCVDVFNPKVVQSAMGSIARVNLFYTEIDAFLEQQKNKGNPVYGAFLDGKNLYTTTIQKKGFLVLGNESNGISEKTAKFVTHRLHIPQFTEPSHEIDSLNVSVACAVFCSEFSRGSYSK